MSLYPWLERGDPVLPNPACGWNAKFGMRNVVDQRIASPGAAALAAAENGNPGGASFQRLAAEGAGPTPVNCLKREPAPALFERYE